MSTKTIEITDRSELAEGDVATFEWDAVPGVLVTGDFLGSDGPEWRISQHDAEGRPMFVSRLPKGAWTLRGATREVSAWEAQELYTATVNGTQHVRVVYADPGDAQPWQALKPTGRDARRWFEDHEVTDARPLVVIDPAEADVTEVYDPRSGEWIRRNPAWNVSETRLHELAVHSGITDDHMRRILADLGIEVTR